MTLTVTDVAGNEAAPFIQVITVDNADPTAVTDDVSTNEDTPVTISVLGNDTDPAGSNDTLTVTGATGASNGTLSFTGTGVTYTPNPDFNGSDSFSYTIADEDGGTATGTVNVTVDQVNDPGTFGGALIGGGNEDAGPVAGTATFTDAIDGFTTPNFAIATACLLYTSPSPRDATLSRMPSSA